MSGSDITLNQDDDDFYTFTTNSENDDYTHANFQLFSAQHGWSTVANTPNAVTACPRIVEDNRRMIRQITMRSPGGMQPYFISATLSGKGKGNPAANYQSIVAGIYFDGEFCAWDRESVAPGTGGRVMASATCNKFFEGDAVPTDHTIILCPSAHGISNNANLAEIDREVFIGNVSMVK